MRCVFLVSDLASTSQLFMGWHMITQGLSAGTCTVVLSVSNISDGMGCTRWLAAKALHSSDSAQCKHIHQECQENFAVAWRNFSLPFARHCAHFPQIDLDWTKCICVGLVWLCCCILFSFRFHPSSATPYRIQGLVERSLEVKFPTIWHMWEKSEKRKNEKKEDQRREVEEASRSKRPKR